MCPVVLGGMHRNKSRACAWNETFAGRMHQSAPRGLIFVFVVIVQDIYCQFQVVVCVKGLVLKARASTLLGTQASLLVAQPAPFCVYDSRPPTTSALSSVSHG